MIRLITTLGLSIIAIFITSCAQNPQLMFDGQSRYRELPTKQAEAYQEACREAFEKLNVRRDIQIKGPVVYRDMTDNQIVAKYHFGFITRYVTRFDAGSPPRISDTYFEDYDTDRRTKTVPQSIKTAEQDAPSNGG